MRVCPRCTLLNPDTAVRCDCGFDFTTSSSVVVMGELADSQRQALRGAVRGLLLGIGALALSIAYQLTTGYGAGLIFFFAFGFGGLALTGRSITRIVDIRKAKGEIERRMEDAAATGAPITIKLGQSREAVTAALGPPQKVMELGPKTIFVYNDLKITFTDGKVADVQ